MFSLLSGFLRWLFSKKEVQILILGLDHAGKTTLLEQMKGFFQRTDTIPLDRIPPTVGLNIGRMDINNCRVIFWDLGGQARLRSIWDNYYAEAHGLLFVVDAADSERFEEAKQALESLLQHPDLAGIPLLFCANKQDLPHAKSAEEIDEYFEITRRRRNPSNTIDGSTENSGSDGSTNSSSKSSTDDANSLDKAKTSDTSKSIGFRGRQRQRRLQAVSALTCAGVEEGVRWLVNCAANNPDIIRARSVQP